MLSEAQCRKMIEILGVLWTEGDKPPLDLEKRALLDALGVRIAVHPLPEMSRGRRARVERRKSPENSHRRYQGVLTGLRPPRTSVMRIVIEVPFGMSMMISSPGRRVRISIVIPP